MVLATKKSIVVVVLGGVNSLHRVLFASVFPIEGKKLCGGEGGIEGENYSGSGVRRRKMGTR